ncbi:hypothetical protein Btru_077147 [Bulinus truncatus]|nr:hypothetical protein Btru_077147 [Bulinus truncatus]
MYRYSTPYTPSVNVDQSRVSGLCRSPVSVVYVVVPSHRSVSQSRVSGLCRSPVSVVYVVVPSHRSVSESRVSGLCRSPVSVVCVVVPYDVKDFEVCDAAMKHLGFSDADRLGIYGLVAGILHLGNIAFEDNADDAKGGCKVTKSAEDSLQMAATLLCVDKEELRDSY